MNNNRKMRGRFRGRGHSNRGSWPRRGGTQRVFDGNRERHNYDRRAFNPQWKPRPKRDVPSKRLSEADIGVTEYINEHEGFNGIIKTRFSDFHVSEINEKDETAKLTNMSPPQPPAEDVVIDDEDLLLNKYNLEILPMDTWDRINKIAMSADSNVEKIEVDVTGWTKEQRTRIHDAVKKAFGESIVGSTVTLDNKKFVTFQKYRKGIRIDNRVKWVWPGEFVYFVVYKENCDTMEAASRIAERLRLNAKSSLLGYAGTKDRRAKTSQWFSLRKFDPRKIAACCKDLRDIKIGNFSFSNKTLKLGMLKGNKFRLCLRNVTASEECVNEACELLKEKGFINYYGLQRFGTRIEVPTYEIGKKLLQGNFREAIRGILSQRDGPLSQALQVYHNVNAHAAVQYLPRNAPSIESKLLQSLAHNANDLVGAIDKVARNTRLLYVHSYQSLIWNRVVSERLRKYSHKPVPGDLVPLGEVQNDEMEEESESEDQNEETDKDVADKDNNTDSKLEEDASDEIAQHNKRGNISKTMIPVKVLTQEDVDSGSYSLSDVVLPLPGSSVLYPPNMKDFYEELLKKDELELTMKHKNKKYCMSGGYRHMVVCPSDLQWSYVRYSDPHADLILSDADELAGITTTGAEEDGKFKALLLTMTLPTSCYATMALRELMKVDTSCDNQALQNNYHKKQKDEQQNKEEISIDNLKNENDKMDDQTEENNENREKKLESSAEKRKADDENLDVKKPKQEDDT